MAAGKGISGVAVAIATAGALLLYAGIRDVNPAQALRDVTSGKAPGVAVRTAGLQEAAAATDAAYADYASGGGSGGSASGSALVQAAYSHKGDRYSQARRWQPGYSDCSSFVGKALKDVGIKPPGGSVTGTYRVWSKLHTIARADIQPGDILCGPGHVSIAVGSGLAIGMQNSRQNVRVDKIESIMYGQSGWVPRRFGGAGAGSGTVRI